MNRWKRSIATLLLLVMISDLIMPLSAFALSSGPSAPEVQGFQPANASDMVNLFTGDASYNIPLLDVEGYPVNLFYNAGISMDQEASWVGLGWNLNPGSVDRNMRGIPDDFNGEEIVRNMNLRPNRTYGVNYDVGLQLFSTEIMDELGNVVGTTPSGPMFNFSFAPSFNNYDGCQFDLGVAMSMRSTKEGKSSVCGSLGMTSSSNRGLQVRPSFGFDSKEAADKYRNSSAGLNFGLTLDSRAGLAGLSFGATVNASRKGTNSAIPSAKLSQSGGIKAGFDFGAPAYSPQVLLPMKNTSVSFSFTGGGAAMGGHPNMTLGGHYSEQRLVTKIRRTPSFGYLYLEAGQMRDDAQLDFNREKDGPYSGDRAALGIANLTNDFFTVSGQGISGSYRAFRSEMGHVYDPQNGSSGTGGSGGLDLGAGLLAHGGARIMVNSSSSKSGRWNFSGNQAGERLRYRTLTDRPDLEKVYFREANEATVQQDSALWVAMRKNAPMRFTIPSNGAFDNRLGAQLVADGAGTTELPTANYRQRREPRSQLFTYLDHATAQNFALQQPIEHVAGVAKNHHMSEVSVLNDQGSRYVFGLPAYNIHQADVEFNIMGATSDANDLVSYDPGSDADVGNQRGKDHFFSKTETPSYAYAFLLSAVLSTDYSDIDEERGPSDGDLGTYTRFVYKQVDAAMPWRTPMASSPNKARFIENTRGTAFDDKATYSYGTKEVYALDTIVSKNRIAVFHTSARQDAMGADQHGNLAFALEHRLLKLDSISLYDKVSYMNDDGTAPLKRVHFRYDYELCQGTPNSDASGNGKLTLKRVWFTYGASRLGVSSPYRFVYNSENPTYKAADQDRWGNYKETDGVANDIYPYAQQRHSTADEQAGAWNLTKIHLPSGGMVELEYEADDYAFVQDRRAMRMMRVIGLNNDHTTVPASSANWINDDENSVLWFELPGVENAWPEGTSTSEINERLFEGVDELYFRVNVKLWGTDNVHDHVSGYARIESNEHGVVSDGVTHRGWVRLKTVTIDEDGGFSANPIYRSALEYLQLNYPEKIANSVAPSLDDNSSVTRSFLFSVVGSVGGFITQLGDFFQGPNASMAGRPANYCRSVDLSQSWIRLNEPDRIKKGGGHRVSRVAFSDKWDVMEEQEDDESFSYTQSYTYGNEQGSWGVAAYEPMMGADENPFRQPVYTVVERALSPDQRFYLEEPFGEAMFPSPLVGYSKVIVQDDIADPTVRLAQGTGRVVNEFYTARDFPTLVSRTGISPDGRRSNNPNLLAILGFKKIDHMHGSQGFLVETNDMHGKPKKTSVYPQGSDQVISYVQYNYGSRWDGSKNTVVNTETVIDVHGNVGRADIGVDHEFVADTRESTSRAMSGGADVKFELLYAFVAAIPVPLCLPQLSWESTRYKTGVLVKKVHRFGRLRETIKMENGSVLSTENLAYDAITGQVLVTRTANDFKDPVYSMSFPAYWYHDGMGPAYRNIGTALNISVNGSGFSHAMASSLFTPGDELALTSPAGLQIRAWVDEVSGNTVRLTAKQLIDVASGNYTLKLLRSGRRNMQGVPMMTVTSMSDPLIGLSGNGYSGIINASASEFSSGWETECACFPDVPDEPILNPWVLNLKGVWRLSKENVWLTERTRSVANTNTNIRRDGVYTSFDAFYKVNNGHWEKDVTGWTATREVTHYSNRGQELENMDALGLFSSASFGYGGSLAKSVARNAMYREAGFDGFEENATPVDCRDRHFRFVGEELDIEDGMAHTGKRSLRVTAGSNVPLRGEQRDCSFEPCKTSAQYSVGLGKILLTSTAFPVTTEYEVLSGEVALVQDSPTSLTPTPTTGWTVRVILVDNEGCRFSTILNVP